MGVGTSGASAHGSGQAAVCRAGAVACVKVGEGGCGGVHTDAQRESVIQWIIIFMMLTIAELPEYIRRAEKLMSASERLDIVNYLAAHPKAGDLIEGTGGIRKLRWGRGAQGKSGGVRIIYYVHSDLMPLYLLTLFAKNERANISKAERNELAALVHLLVQIWLES
jgi:hypothetical protein